MRTLATRLARGLHKRVVSRRVDFDPDGFLDPLDVLKLRTQPLWRGTEGVAVLSKHTLVILDLDLDFVTLSESRFGQERPNQMGRLDLTRVGASMADKGIKRATRAQHGFYGQRGQDL